MDLREEWKYPLLQEGFRINKRTLWLVEGLLMYLEESQVEILLSRITNIASLKDIMLLDILSRSLLEAPHMKKQLEFLAAIGASWKVGVNDPEGFMTKFGWSTSLTQAGEVAPNRWPFPTVPLHIPDVPRGFFVEARKV